MARATARTRVSAYASASSLVWVATFAAVIALTLLGHAALALADPVAVVAAVKGKVEITPAHSKLVQRATFGRALEAGDRIVVAPGGSATLFFNDGNVIELGEKSSVTVGGKVAANTGKGKSGISTDVYASVTKFITAGSRQTGLVAVSEMRGGTDATSPLVLSPRKSAVLTTAPALEWRAVAGATRYRVTLSSAEAGELWSREVDADPKTVPGNTVTLAWPADVPKLAPDAEFLWQLDALNDIKSLRSDSSVFRTSSQSLRDGVASNLTHIADSAGGVNTPAARYLAGSYLSGLGLYHDAVTQFQALTTLSPDSAAPHEALGDVYSKVGLMDLAAAEYQQALALGRDTP